MEIKICAIADIHGSLIDIPECDILCICGDILPLHIQRKEFTSIAWLSGPFQKWCLEAPCNHVIMIWGNHDFIGEKLYNKPKYMQEGWEQEELLFQNDDKHKIHILQDESVVINNIKFYGTPWCPALTSWAFYGNSDELKNKFENIPYDTNVLLTHCPPKFGQQGIVLQPNNWNYLSNFGCEELQEAIEKKFALKSTTTHIFSGHIHSGNHNEEVSGGLVYRNVSIKDENYDITYSPKITTIYV